ncbi:MAG: trigger factor [Planctomycetes bacterium]|nr:trigger factor [Planctomycetota bacterium]
MQITVENAGGCKRIIRAEIPADTVATKLNEGYRDLNRQVSFPGYRKGKAPRHLLEKRFGREVVNDVRQTLADDALRSAVDQHSLKLLGQPELVGNPELAAAGPVVLTLEAEVFPEFTVPTYKGLEIERPAADVEEHEVYAQMRTQQMGEGELNQQDRPSQKGDLVRASVLVKAGEEVIFQQGGGLLEVGYGWIAGLKPGDAETQLVGLKGGDKKEIKANLPANFGREDLRGKEVNIEIIVNDVLEFKGPTLDEVAAKKGHADRKTWEDEVRAAVKAQKDNDIDRFVEEKAILKVTESTTMDLPEKFSRRKAAELVQQQAYRMYRSGMPEDDIRTFLQENKDKGVDDVKNMLKRAFVVDAIAKAERIVITEEELQREVGRIAASIGRSAEEVNTELNQTGRLSGMREELKTGKVLSLLRQKAKYL